MGDKRTLGGVEYEVVAVGRLAEGGGYEVHDGTPGDAPVMLFVPRDEEDEDGSEVALLQPVAMLREMNAREAAELEIDSRLALLREELFMAGEDGMTLELAAALMRAAYALGYDHGIKDDAPGDWIAAVGMRHPLEDHGDGG